MPCCHDDLLPCSAPPAPDLLQRRREHPEEVEYLDLSGDNYGFNDGAIFTKEHFPDGAPPSTMINAAAQRSPLRGVINIAIVLAQFPDKGFRSPSIVADFHRLFFSKGQIPTKSVTEFFEDVSGGLISMAGEVKGPFTLPHPITHYANNKIRPLGKFAEYERHGGYDNDKNGQVDCYIVVHAGTGAETSGNKNDLWSVKWVMPNQEAANGTNIFAFLTIPEDARIGVSAHEIGHLIFGWPDLYDTDNRSDGIGAWCLMAGGSWGNGGNTPAHPSAWCKVNQGWVRAENQTDNRDLVVDDVKRSKAVYRAWGNGDVNSREYYLIENRQQDGFDKSLPGNGILIWHIDDAIDSNRFSERWQKVTLRQADGKNQLRNKQGSDAGDLWPGSANNRNFTPSSNPSSKAHAGHDSLVRVSGIGNSGGRMNLGITVRSVTQLKNNKWYRLRNGLWDFALDTVNNNGKLDNGRLWMAAVGDVGTQKWQFIIPRGREGSDEYYIRVEFGGLDHRLDVRGNPPTSCYLENQNNGATGQLWHVTPNNDGTFHLWNDNSTNQRLLDTKDGSHEPFMEGANGHRWTQNWTISEIDEIKEKRWLE